jgi:hypothetical protein
MTDGARLPGAEQPEVQSGAIQARQFEPPECTASPALTCGQCHQEITRPYYESAGQVLCESCRNRLPAPLPAGSGVKRFYRAMFLGELAATAGAGLYFAITTLTGYELGLMAIVVGLLVGGAVRWGSQRRGGWRYQALAMFLTYNAIVTTYVPPLLTGLQQALNMPQNQETAAPSASDSSAVETPAPAALLPTAQTVRPPHLLSLAVGVLYLYLLACVAPFLGGVQNLMGLVIIGIGLYAAWKLNKRVPLQLTGPHAIGTVPARTSTPQA